MLVSSSQDPQAAPVADKTHLPAESDPALITKPQHATWNDQEFGTACVVRKHRLKWLPNVAHPSERSDTRECADDAGIVGAHTRARKHAGLLDADVIVESRQA